jgi:hypothetical protein
MTASEGSGGDDALERGRDFIRRNARVLEQRLFSALFESASPQGIVEALRGYRNDDGGFGHGLEPDKRCPDSQPLDVLFALETMDAAGAFDGELAQGSCRFLVTVADERGAVPSVLPSVAAYPHANHWAGGEFPPELNPTAGIAGLLHKHGVEHEWREQATRFSLEELGREPPTDAHAIRQVLVFLEHVPDRARAEALAGEVGNWLRAARWFKPDPADESYGLGPLEFAPEPDSRWRSLFSDDEIEHSLAHLKGEQQADGGWPITWEPPGEASALEWRAIWTLSALRVVAAYGWC